MLTKLKKLFRLSAPATQTIQIGGNSPPGEVRDFFRDLLGGEQAIMGYGATRRPVELISGMIAAAPIHCYQHDTDGSREKDLQNAAYRLLQVRPNSWQTPYVYRANQFYHRLIYQNSYSLIIRDEWANPVELLPLHPHDCYPRILDGELLYSVAINRYTTPDAPPEFTWRLVQPSDIIHLRGIGTAIAGDSLLHIAKRALGLSLALQTFAANFFTQGAMGYRFVDMPPECKDEATRKNFIDGFRRQYEGTQNGSRTMFVPYGAKVSTDQIDNDQQMMLGTQEADLVNCANLFGIPPYFVGARTNSSYKGLEHESRTLLRSINHYLVEAEQEYESKLLSEFDKRTGRRHLEFDRSALVEYDRQEITNDIIAKKNASIISVEESRQALNLSPQRDENQTWHRLSTIVVEGEEPTPPTPSIVQLPAEPPEVEGEPEPDDDSENVTQRLVESIVERLRVRLQKAITKASVNWEGERSVFGANLRALPNASECVSRFFDELESVLPEQRAAVLDTLDHEFARKLCG